MFLRLVPDKGVIEQGQGDRVNDLANAIQVLHRIKVVFVDMTSDFVNDFRREERDRLQNAGVGEITVQNLLPITHAITENLHFSFPSVESQLLQLFRSTLMFGNGQHVG